MRTISIGLTVMLATSIDALERPRIEIHKVGNDVQIVWNSGALQTASAINGNWTFVPGAGSPHNITLQQRAFFRVQETYSVTVTKAGAGTGIVRSAPVGIECGSDCSEVFLSGQSVKLQALPDAGSTFTGWTGDCAGTGDCEVTINFPKTVTATFARAATANAVANSGFEEGPLVAWQQQPGQLIYTATQLSVPAHTGNYLARLGYDTDNRRLARIGQQITLPNSTPLYLNFATWIYSEESCDVPYYDAITIYVAGQPVVSEDRVCRGSHDTGGWRRYSIDLTAIAGQTVPVVFEISSADVLTSIMLLDDISIQNQPWQ